MQLPHMHVVTVFGTPPVAYVCYGSRTDVLRRARRYFNARFAVRTVHPDATDYVKRGLWPVQLSREETAHEISYHRRNIAA